MKRTGKVLAMSLALTFLVCSMLNISAAKYVANVVAEDFETSATDFLQPGDIDADGDIDTADYTELRGLILKSETATYSDANGDNVSNICDLVLQNENKATDFVSDGAMNLNGKSYYGAEITSVITTGAEYKVIYETSGDVTVKLNGLKDYDGNAVTVTESGYTFKTATAAPEDVELYVIGNGTVKNFAITRINMDNDYSVSAS